MARRASRRLSLAAAPLLDGGGPRTPPSGVARDPDAPLRLPHSQFFVAATAGASRTPNPDPQAPDPRSLIP
jgi:hypothetical protein